MTHQNMNDVRTTGMNPKIIGLVVVIIAVAGGAFYGGTAYAKSQAPARGGQFTGQFNGQAGTAGAGARSGTRVAGGGFTAGQILSKDDTSLTVKMQDGSTKIILFSGSTMITKSASGTPQDLKEGTQVTVMGTTNQDGSVTAQDILLGGGFGSMRMGGMGGMPPAGR